MSTWDHEQPYPGAPALAPRRAVRPRAETQTGTGGVAVLSQGCGSRSATHGHRPNRDGDLVR